MKYTQLYWGDVRSVLASIPNLNELFHRNILVTGATGMICSAVTDILLFLNHSQNAEIKLFLAGRDRNRIVERFAGFEEGRDYEFLYYDAIDGQLNTAGLVHIDYVVHGAGNAHPAAYVSQPVETIMANIVGLHTLLQIAIRYEGRRLLYISSSEVYGQKETSRPYMENDYGYVDILNPRACYPCSKRLAETLCVAYGKEYNLETVIVRPGHIYGPTMTSTDSRAASQFIRSAVNGKQIVMKSAGTQLRSYCHVLDCASAILAVLINGETGNAYNISYSKSIVTIRKFAETVAREAGSFVVFENPSDIERNGYNLMDNSALNSEKIELLGWSGHFDLLTGIAKTIFELEDEN